MQMYKRNKPLINSLLVFGFMQILHTYICMFIDTKYITPSIILLHIYVCEDFYVVHNMLRTPVLV